MTKRNRAPSLTTITLATASEFLRSATVNQQLFCQRIPGLYLMKQKRGGVWRYRYTNAEGKRRVAKVGNYVQLAPDMAASIVLEWMADGVDPLEEKASRKQAAIKTRQQREHRTLSFYLENYYLPHMERSWKPKNVQTNYGRITGHFAPLLNRDMAGIDKADIDAWQREAEKKGRAFSTIKRTYGALKTLLRKAVQDGILESDPLAGHKLLEPTLKHQKAQRDDPKKSERRLLTDEEITGILKGLDLFAEEIREQRRNSRAHGKAYLPNLDNVIYPHWFIPFCLLALHTGLRPGDLYTLTWRELNVPFARLTKVCEKTAHAARRERKPAVVDMKLTASIKAVMADWRKAAGDPADGLVFPSPRTGRQLDMTAHRKPWSRIKELGEVPAGLNFYSLRHHFISAQLAAGVSVFTVAKLAGHKDVKMIMEHYGHLCPNQAAEALDIVARSVTMAEKNSRNSG